MHANSPIIAAVPGLVDSVSRGFVKEGDVFAAVVVAVSGSGCRSRACLGGWK